MRAGITDIFSSVQGEGIFLGARQIFVRFKNCNLNCSYCDEPRDGEIFYYTPPGLMSKIREFHKTRVFYHSVSLTGGEPLCYVNFLERFLPLLHDAGMKSYLETNGTLPDELGRVIDFIDIVAMDFKLPSSSSSGLYWDEHERFLKIAHRKKLFIKVVVTKDTSVDDMRKAMDIVKRFNKNIPFILQPATAALSDNKVCKGRLMEFVELGIENDIDNIRVIPQFHKMIGIK